MPIPDFQSLMRPLLDCANDGKEHALREVIERLAVHFGLTDADRKQLLPSGNQEVFVNRVAWAKTHLKMAGLLDSPKRGYSSITPLGLNVLADFPERIDLKVLRQQPGYLEARGGTKSETQNKTSPQDVEASQTPEEQIELASLALRSSLGSEILSKLRASSPSFFENLVVELLVAMGYGGTRKDAGQAIGRSGDEGIDGIIKEDRLGLDTIYIQAKRWLQTVGRPEIQKFAGALQGFRAKKGIFITTSDFSREAIEYAFRIESRIVLIDGEMLWNLMIDFGIGVSKTATYEIKKIDNDYFDEENA
jgi:restriction system protein